jgi:membrane protein DedA with SNARE-associated domain
MNYWKFLLYTTIGAGCWHAILAALGWYLHAIVPEEQLNDKIEEYAEYIKLIIVALVIAAIVWFAVRQLTKKKNTKN